jgi:hypothetical protein
VAVRSLHPNREHRRREIDQKHVADSASLIAICARA